jgi:hypothetical protein
MTELLETAIAEVSTLPEAAQQKIGRDLLTYIERLRWLQAEIDKGLHSLNAGEGRELDIDAFLQELHERHGGR